MTQPLGFSYTAPAAAGGLVTVVLTYTWQGGDFTHQSDGIPQTLYVPANIAGPATFELYGAPGGSFPNNDGTFTHGGKGGYVKATIDLTPGGLYWLLIGGHNFANGPAGPYNGGGSGSFCSAPGGAGGGGTDLRTDWSDVNSRLLVAGGGGGGGGYSPGGGHGTGFGGDAGHPNGGAGFAFGIQGDPGAGGGGTQLAGGASGGGTSGPGVKGAGGDAQSGGAAVGGGGGGGGLFGGGAAAFNLAADNPGGGGGSSAVIVPGATHITYDVHTLDHGLAVVTYQVTA